MPLLNFGLLCRELRVALVGTKKTFFFRYMNNFVKGWNRILSVLINSFALSHR